MATLWHALHQHWQHRGPESKKAAESHSQSLSGSPSIRSPKAALEVSKQLFSSRAASAADALLAYAQRCPAVLAKRTSNSHSTLWHRAAESGQLGLLHAFVGLVRQHAAAVRAAVVHRYTLRIMAPNLDGEQTLLLKLINGSNAHGMTPLHLAALAGRADVVEFLLQLGADACKTDYLGFRTPLHCAAIGGHAACVTAIMLQMGTARDPQGVRFIDYRTLSGMTALHYAAGLGHATATRSLIEHGANVSLPKLNSFGDVHITQGAFAMSTPLHMAAYIGHNEICHIILKHYATYGRRRTPRMPDPRTALNNLQAKPHHMALSTGNDDLAWFLNPARRLSELFPELASSNAVFAVPSLADLAKAALTTKLECELVMIQSQLQLQQQQQQQASATVQELEEEDEEEDEEDEETLLPPCTAHAKHGATCHCDEMRHHCQGQGSSDADAASSSSSGGGEAGTTSYSPSSSVRYGSDDDSAGCSTAAGEAQMNASSSASQAEDDGGIDDDDDDDDCGCLPQLEDRRVQRSAAMLVALQRSANMSASLRPPASLLADLSFLQDTAGTGGATREDETCDVCFDQVKSVAIDGCGHHMCSDCALALIHHQYTGATAGKPAPVACPFCRAPIGGFHGVYY